MTTYIIKTRTKAFNKPGLNPTTKNGTDMGWMEAGQTFESTRTVNGWRAVNDASNKWVMESATEKASEDPPVEPPPDEPPANDNINVEVKRVDDVATVTVTGSPMAAVKVVVNGEIWEKSG